MRTKVGSALEHSDSPHLLDRYNLQSADCPRLSFPMGPNNNVTPNIVDVMVVENGDRILYISTGAPVEGPQPMLPLTTRSRSTTPTSVATYLE